MKRIGKTKILAAALVVLLFLSGCGKQAVNMKEYTVPDGTYSIEADESYTMTDAGMDNWMLVEAEDGTDNGLVVMQFPKVGGFLGGWSSLEDVITYMEDANELTDREEITKPENEQLSNIKAYSYKVEQEESLYDIRAVYGETDYAYYLFMNSELKLKGHSADYFGTVCASFKENAEVIEEKTAVAEVSDTIRWFNASNAILINANNWNYQIYGGLEPGDSTQAMVRQLLEDSWGVTDTDSAWETLNWLMTEGHRMGFIEDMEFFEEIGLGDAAEDDRVSFLLENFEIDEEEAEYYARLYRRYEEAGEDAASGWDYNRALSQIANFYLAGYFTLEESLDASLDVAEWVQASFTSWDDYMESYFTGYEYWAEESSDGRREIYESLQNAADNPYSVDFNMALEKSW